MHGFLNEQDALFMNPNFPPKIMGGAAFIEYVNKIKVKSSSGLDDMLILDGGNFFQGHPVGIVDSGKTMELVTKMYPKAHFCSVYAKPMGRDVVNTFITEVSQDTWIFFPWDMALQYVAPFRGDG